MIREPRLWGYRIVFMVDERQTKLTGLPAITILQGTKLPVRPDFTRRS